MNEYPVKRELSEKETAFELGLWGYGCEWVCPPVVRLPRLKDRVGDRDFVAGAGSGAEPDNFGDGAAGPDDENGVADF